MSKVTVHIISHTHWDREWYLNSPYVNEWLPPFFEALFAMLDKEPNYRFVLDGQTSMIDDCCAELAKSAKSDREFLSRIEAYARQGRLILGPYFLQPDWQLISEESIVRNMLIGAEMSRALGGGTQTGWVLDNFGQIAQAPQIHKQFGMRGIVVWRGVELDPHNMRSEFFWRSPDGTVLPCGYLLSSYRSAMRLADYTDIVQQRIRNEVEKVAPFAGTPNILLMNGYDQEMQPDDILPHISGGKADFKDFAVRQSTPDEYMSALAQGMGQSQSQELAGALYSGRYISVFPGILSSRIYLKLQNHLAQTLLSHYVEPLSVMSMLLSSHYPTCKLEETWKLLLKNHPHDSICGVGVDDVHTDMEQRFACVDVASRDILQYSAASIIGATDTTCFGDAQSVFTIFNTLPVPRRARVFLPDCSGEVRNCRGEMLSTQVVQGGLLSELSLPAMGFTTVGVYRCNAQELPLDCNNRTAENEHLKLRVNPDGTLWVEHKATGRCYDRVGYLEDSADSGDEYNYSWLAGDKAVTTIGQAAEVTCVEQGTLRTVWKIERKWSLPVALAADRKSRSSDNRTIPITTFVTLEKGSERIDFCTVLRNCCRDHRVRVLFPTQIATDKSLAHTQFCITPHPIHATAVDNSQIPPEVARIIIGARESAAITQFPQQEFVAVEDGAVGAAVLNRGLPEYEVLPEDTTIALTLLRGVGWLARFDLNTRIGDAGPEMFVPDAQCLREMRFEYAFMPYAGELAESPVLDVSQDYQVPASVAQSAVHAGPMQPESSFLSVVPSAGLRYSAIKKAEASDDVLVRVYNTGRSAANATIVAPLISACAYNLAEEKVSDLPVAGGTVTMSVAAGQIATIACRLHSSPLAVQHPAVKLCPQWQYSADLSGYPLPPAVEEEEILREEHRADIAEADYQKALEKHRTAEEALAGKGELATLSLQVQSTLRASLEARLSAILVRKNFSQQPDGAVQEEIRRIAYRLNLARIDKRVGEYIKDYYEQNASSNLPL